MITLKIAYPSISLLKPVEITVGVPGKIAKSTTKLAIIWLLHPAMEDGCIFFNKLNISDFVDKFNFIAIAPSMGNGYFVNSVYEKQGDFLQELFFILPNLLPIDKNSAKHGIIGISMGGFGAARWAFQTGDFVSIATISGVFNCLLPLDERIRKQPKSYAIHKTFAKLMNNIFLDKNGILNKEADLEYIIKNNLNKLVNVNLFCGENDYLSLQQNEYMQKICIENNVPVNLSLSSGAHNIGYWSHAFPQAINLILKDFRK